MQTLPEWTPEQSISSLFLQVANAGDAKACVESWHADQERVIDEELRLAKRRMIDHRRVMERATDPDEQCRAAQRYREAESLVRHLRHIIFDRYDEIEAQRLEHFKELEHVLSSFADLVCANAR